MNFIPTFFNVGNVSYMPGTFASFIALAIAIPLVVIFDRLLLVFAFLILLIAYFCAVPKFIKQYGESDPSCVVADEVLGQWFVVMFLQDFTLFNFSIAFIFFRLFDILKPYPINVLDDKSRYGSYFKQSFFVLADDILAAILSIIFVYFTNLLIH